MPAQRATGHSGPGKSARRVVTGERDRQSPVVGAGAGVVRLSFRRSGSRCGCCGCRVRGGRGFGCEGARSCRGSCRRARSVGRRIRSRQEDGCGGSACSRRGRTSRRSILGGCRPYQRLHTQRHHPRGSQGDRASPCRSRGRRCGWSKRCRRWAGHNPKERGDHRRRQRRAPTRPHRAAAYQPSGSSCLRRPN
jgi:hypothetical protein